MFTIPATLIVLLGCLGGTYFSSAELVAHWPLDESAEDVIGGHHGTASNGVIFGAEGAAAHTGTAAEFDGASATITVPHSADLNPPSFTVVLWASADSVGGFASALTSRDDDGNSVSGFLLYNDSAGRWNFWTGGGGASGSWRQLPGPTVEVGSWTHLAVSFDAPSDTMSLHVNGRLEQSITATDLYVPNGPQQEDLHLGSGSDNGSQFHFDGLLDEVALWNEALTTAEIREVMNNGVPGGAPLVQSFTADPPRIKSGESTTLSWATLRASSLVISPEVGEGAVPAGSVTVSPTETTTYTLTARGETGPDVVREVTVGVNVGESPPVISEFLADNGDGLVDADGDQEDWIEIHNPNPFAIDLGGWSLTDDPARPGKWVFPSLLLEGGGYLVVFASQKNGPLDLSFRLAASGEYLALVSPDGEIVQEFAPRFPPQFEDVSYGLPSGGGDPTFLLPTPGGANGAELVEVSPAILSSSAEPVLPGNDDDLIITAEVEPRLGEVSAVYLIHRVNFEEEDRVAMTALGDSRYQASIPAASYAPGDMVRWRITARTAGGQQTRDPPFPDPLESAEYHGTVIADPSLETELPVLHWFVENPSANDTRAGARASVYFKGRFYDNIFSRIRGQSTANLPKHKYKFDFYRGGHFFWREGAPKVEEFNLNSHFRDGYVRENAIFGFLNEAGTPAPETMYLWARRNGEDMGLFSFVEQIDEEFLGRHGFDATGAMYKAINVPATLSPNVNSSLYRKVLQREEPYDDLVEFAARINVSNPERFSYVADEVNLPNYINVMAAMAVPFNHDQLTKNYYLYRDPHRKEWFRFPWDGDQGLPTGTKNTHENWASPLYGDARHTQELVGGAPNPTWQNHMHAAILDNPVTREMYMRRLRNLADQYLTIPPGQNGWFEDLLRSFRSEISRDATRDYQIWSVRGINTLSNGIANVVNTSLPQRRIALFETYGPPGEGLLPGPEPADPVVTFGAIDYNPESGDQDEEFIELVNENQFAVDLSGWSIEGGIAFTFPPGAVIPARGRDPERGKAFLSPDVAAFRSRAVSPTGGESRLVLGNYDGHLSNFGETLTLRDAAGRIVAQHTLPSAPSEVQRYLVVSEIMYHPAEVAESEFIEFLNLSPTVTLDLTGVVISDGVAFDFTGSAITSLAPGERVLVVRDLPSFEAVYGRGHPVAGSFEGGSALSNAGERIKVDDASGSTAIELTYGDSEPWPTAADGSGHSLTMIDPEAGSEADQPGRWRSSVLPGGSPGTQDREPYDGGDLLTYALLTEPIVKLNAAGQLTVSCDRWLGADDAEVLPQWSPDLVNWEVGPLVLEMRVPDGRGAESVTWRLPTGVKGFVRLQVVLR